MPVPKRKKGESKNEFMSRCISELIKVDTNRSKDQIIAICGSTWREGRKSLNAEIDKNIQEKQINILFANVIPRDMILFCNVCREDVKVKARNITNGKVTGKCPKCGKILFSDVAEDKNNNNKDVPIVPSSTEFTLPTGTKAVFKR